MGMGGGAGSNNKQQDPMTQNIPVFTDHLLQRFVESELSTSIHLNTPDSSHNTKCFKKKFLIK